MALTHARQHADNEAHAANNHRHRQGRILEGYHNFLQHIGHGEDLDEVQNADDIKEHFPIQRPQRNLLQADEALGKAQHKEQAHCYHGHAHGGVQIKENN